MNRIELKAKARENIRKDKFSVILITLIATLLMGGVGTVALSVPFFGGVADFLTVAPRTSQTMTVQQTAKSEGFDIDDFLDDDGNIDSSKYFGMNDSDHSSRGGSYDPYEDYYDEGDYFFDIFSDEGDGWNVDFGNVGLTLVIFLLTGALTAGLLYYHRKLWKGETGELKDLFVKFDKDFPRITKMYLLQTLYVFLWTLLLVVPGIVMSIAYSQAYFLMLDDPELSATDALNKSKELMKGRKWDYFVMLLSFLGWMILGVMTFGILLLWVEPYLIQTLTGYYEEVILPAKKDADARAAEFANAPAESVRTAPAETVTEDGVAFADVEPSAPETPEAPKASVSPEASAAPEMPRMVPGKQLDDDDVI